MLTAYLTYPMLNNIICGIVCFIGMVTDTWKGRIYNWLTFPAIIIGWILCFYFNGLAGLGYSVLGTLVGIGLWLPLAVIGAYGMGDVKIMGAIGAVCGTAVVLNVSLYACGLGFFHALIVHFLNYGTSAIARAIISIKTGNFTKNTIQKENTNEKTRNNIKFTLGIDIFLGLLLAYWHMFTW